jgi:uncharacterized protein YndB with AHSA1/START domain
MADTVSASAAVAATPHDVFEFLRRPENHAAFSGDGSVQGVMKGPEALELGDQFGMHMRILGIPYRVTSRVVAYEPDHHIAWCHLGGHQWQWTVEPASGGSLVTLTYDQSTARFPPALRLVGYPERHRDNVEQSVANVAAHFSDGPAQA